MQKRKSFFPVFLIFFVLSILLFLLSRAGLLSGVTGFFESATVPLQRAVFGAIHINKDDEVTSLREINAELASQIVRQKELERENQALADQFQVANPPPRTLLPSSVIGLRDEKIVIDKGEMDGVHSGAIIIYEENLIGKVVKASNHISVVAIITGDTSMTAYTANTAAQGVVIGENGLTFQNVILSEKLTKGDLVVTKGDVDDGGKGFLPGLVIGKIESIDKKQSSLFQSAAVESLVDFGRLSTVFVITE